jgi:ABC-type polysaccharide/polyol phosphate transport system ATPase subunit
VTKKLIIKIESLYKQYSGSSVLALSNLSCEAYEGDKIGLIGLNGSEKSTLLKILSRHVKPSSGKVTLYKSVQSLAHFDSLLHPDLSGVENIKLQLKILSVRKENRDAAIVDIIDFSELGHFINNPVKTYSSGMMLRLSFSIFKVVQPKILLLDEVFAAGDVVFRKKPEELMIKHLDKVSVIFMVSHELQEIVKYCNRCIVLKQGKIEFSGTFVDTIQQMTGCYDTSKWQE